MCSNRAIRLSKPATMPGNLQPVDLKWLFKSCLPAMLGFMNGQINPMTPDLVYVISLCMWAALLAHPAHCMARPDESPQHANSVDLPEARHLHMVLGLQHEWLAPNAGHGNHLGRYLERLRHTCRRPSQARAWVASLSTETQALLQNKDARLLLPVIRRSYLAAVLLCERQLTSTRSSGTVLDNTDLLNTISRYA